MDSAPERKHASHSSQSDCRGANQPAMITRPSTSGSTNIPAATGLGERTIRYSPIKATIHESTMTDSNGVVTTASSDS